MNKEDLSAIAALPPRVGYSLMIDTSRAPTAACVRAGRSWQNSYTAKLTLAIVGAILKAASREDRDLSVAIIIPYRAQVKLLREKLRELSTNSLWQRYRVTPGTIHQFQGSEADIVLFDMVDGPGQTALGALLRGDTGIRLVNVAITRARGKVILLINQSCSTWNARIIPYCGTSLHNTRAKCVFSCRDDFKFSVILSRTPVLPFGTMCTI